MGIISAIYPVTIIFLNALRSTAQSYAKLSRIYESGFWATFRNVEFPISMRALKPAWQVAVPLSVLGQLLVEWAGVKPFGYQGLGSLIISFMQQGDFAKLMGFRRDHSRSCIGLSAAIDDRFKKS